MTEVKITNIDVPAHYIDKLECIIQSKVLDTVSGIGELHFDKDNKLRKIKAEKVFYYN